MMTDGKAVICATIHVLALFKPGGIVPAMPDDAQQLRPATPDEIAETLSFALRYDSRRRVHHADDAMARITAQRLVEHLERSGFVLMKRPPARAPSLPGAGLWKEFRSPPSASPSEVQRLTALYGLPRDRHRSRRRPQRQHGLSDVALRE
jgi:hypothetical protein